jgi:hypothetical protein
MGHSPSPARIAGRTLPSRRIYRAAVASAVAVVVGWIITINATSTIIVSSINPWFVTAVTLLGGMAGLRTGIIIGAVEAAIGRHRDDSRPRATLYVTAAVGLVCGVVVGATASYRIVDVALFWRSDEPIITATFPIQSVGLATATPILSIGSEGETDGIRISKRDYDVLNSVAPLRRPWRYCIALKRQANYEAVRIWRPSSRLSGPQTVFPCPRYAQWW